MTMERHEGNQTVALTALTELGRDIVERPTPSDLDNGLNSLFARIAAGKTRRRAWARWSLVGATAALVVFVGLRSAWVSRGKAPVSTNAPLAFNIEGGAVLEAGYLRESGHAGIRLSFNDGSKVSLVSGTRGRLRSVDKDGARVALENGSANFQITPNKDRRWRVEAGPFVVTVTGTVFTVAWDPSSELFDLRLSQGRVVVSGPVSGGDVALRSGQRLQVRLAKAETIISEEQAEVAGGDSAATSAGESEASPGIRPSAIEPKAVVSPPANAAKTSESKVESGHRWSRDSARGAWDRILKDVDRAGVERTIESASSDDLFAVASAARYRHRVELAHSALLAVRRRFPDSPRALDALFLLGRVEESRSHGSSRAIAWYDEYLARVSDGAFAAEALGRKMILTGEHGGAEKARPIADEYLRRFPKGSYAGSARAMQQIQ